MNADLLNAAAAALKPLAAENPVVFVIAILIALFFCNADKLAVLLGVVAKLTRTRRRRS